MENYKGRERIERRLVIGCGGGNELVNMVLEER